ncbi:MAG: DUF2953 domain-containing protein [Clostridia bacterium]|nr:DUF2953 domain-containing protein [Clostridia bacterium]
MNRLLLIAALLLMITPITLQADVYAHEGVQARILLRFWGLSRTWRLRLVRTAQGHRLILAGQEGPPKPMHAGDIHGSRAERILGALRRADKARSFLLRHIQLRSLDALVQLRTGDAARTAILTGALRSACCLLPSPWQRRMHLRIVPEFFREHSTLQTRCILFFRLGTIIITTAMVLAAYLTQPAPTVKEAA